MSLMAAPTSGPAGNFILNISTNVAVQVFNISSGTIKNQLSLPYITPGQCTTVDSVGRVIGVPCGSGAASIAVTTGSISGFSSVTSSPTAVINLDSNTFTTSLRGGATVYVGLLNSYLTTSSATATYLQQSSATATYLQLSSATATYLQQSSATATYFQKTAIIPVANGGTGTSSPGLIAGTNITSITGTWPNQTINASGGGGSGGSSLAVFLSSGVLVSSSTTILNIDTTTLIATLAGGSTVQLKVNPNLTISTLNLTGFPVNIPTYVDVYGNLNARAVRLENDISGVLPVANGGTGQNLYSNGQLLVGNSSTGGLSTATITAGSNITVTNGAGSIMIAASGGGGTSLPLPGGATNYWNYPSTATFFDSQGVNVSTITASSTTINGQLTINSKHTDNGFSITAPLIVQGSGLAANGTATAILLQDSDFGNFISTNPAIGIQKYLGTGFFGQYSGSSGSLQPGIQLDYTNASSRKLNVDMDQSTFQNSVTVGDGNVHSNTTFSVLGVTGNSNLYTMTAGTSTYSAGTYQMVVTTTGFLGVGISTPSATLDVNGSVAIRGSSVTINGVRMLWPSSGTIGGYLQYASTNTLLWGSPSGGTSGGASTSLETMVNSVRITSPTATQNFIASTGINMVGSIPAASTAAITVTMSTRIVNSIFQYGAKGDARRVTDSSMTATQNTIQSPTANFTSADIGKAIAISSAAVAHGTVVGTITSITSSQIVVISTRAAYTVTNQLMWVGTDDSNAFLNAGVALSTGATL